MSKIIKRSLASILLLATIISLILSTGMNVSAADFSYVYSGNYIYNWGERGEEATFLSPNAKLFYEDNNTSYEILSSYSGGSGQSDAPGSKLYSELKKLMSGNHTYITSYSATKDLFKYTDCQNNGGKISSFYSGALIGPNWGEGSWNREHTWPNSKGLGGSDEDDIMMLRPTAISENSSRGNTAYGQSKGYYHPNSESGGQYDLRGDVARIFLYVYVRWGNTSYAWGTSGVMESVDVLLEWMEADPVDTWELGRNDSVESITGTRNVFVDYPELAFILFGEEIPDNMSTPSGEGNQDCGHNNFNSGTLVAATCTEEGYTLYACQTYGCNYSYKANLTSSKGHSYTAVVTAPTCVKAGYTTYTCSVCKNSYVGDNVPTIAHKYQDDTCTVCGAIKGSSTEASLSFADKVNRTEFSTLKQVWSQNGITIINNKASSSVNVADYANPARFYASSSIIIEASGNITKIVFDCNSSSYATVLKNSIGSSAMIDSDKVTVELDGKSSNFTIASLTAQVRMDSITVTYAGATPSCQHSNTKIDSAIAPSCTASGLTEGSHCADCGEILIAQQTVSALGHIWLDATTEAPKTCDRCGLTEGEKLPDNQCDHNYSKVVTEPTCTNEGYTTYTCTLCLYSYIGDKVAESGHEYVNNICVDCGAIKAVDSKVTISFNSSSNRIECSAAKQVWTYNGLTITNNKSTSTSDVADYINPVRFYAGSELIIEYLGITKIEFDCTGLDSKYISALLNAPTGATVTNNNGVITLVFAVPVDSVTYSKLSAQCRAHSITVYTEASTEESCQHINITTDKAVAPTCTSTGLTEGKHCSDCGEIIIAQFTVSSLGHCWVDANYESPKTCDRCGLTEGEKLPQVNPDNDTPNENETPNEDKIPGDNETPNEDKIPGDNETPNEGGSSDNDIVDDEQVKDHNQCKDENGGLKNFWIAIINFFRTLFGLPKKCVCGSEI